MGRLFEKMLANQMSDKSYANAAGQEVTVKILQGLDSVNSIWNNLSIYALFLTMKSVLNAVSRTYCTCDSLECSMNMNATENDNNIQAETCFC